MVHRDNKHVEHWPDGDCQNIFFNIYSSREILRFIKSLRSLHQQGYVIFGMQMSPGSLQGFMMHSFLKKIGVLDYIVDFNLINASIITPPKGEYILQLHLNQLRGRIESQYSRRILSFKFTVVILRCYISHIEQGSGPSSCRHPPMEPQGYGLFLLAFRQMG